VYKNVNKKIQIYRKLQCNLTEIIKGQIHKISTISKCLTPGSGINIIEITVFGTISKINRANILKLLFSIY
jgi:hypothetical protein